jgi:hypothetical protein
MSWCEKGVHTPRKNPRKPRKLSKVIHRVPAGSHPVSQGELSCVSKVSDALAGAMVLVLKASSLFDPIKTRRKNS